MDRIGEGKVFKKAIVLHESKMKTALLNVLIVMVIIIVAMIISRMHTLTVCSVGKTEN